MRRLLVLSVGRPAAARGGSGNGIPAGNVVLVSAVLAQLTQMGVMLFATMLMVLWMRIEKLVRDMTRTISPAARGGKARAGSPEERSSPLVKGAV